MRCEFVYEKQLHVLFVQSTKAAKARVYWLSDVFIDLKEQTFFCIYINNFVHIYIFVYNEVKLYVPHTQKMCFVYKEDNYGAQNELGKYIKT